MQDKKNNKSFNNTRRQTINRFKLEINNENVRFSQLICFSLFFADSMQSMFLCMNKASAFVCLFVFGDDKCAYSVHISIESAINFDPITYHTVVAYPFPKV